MFSLIVDQSSLMEKKREQLSWVDNYDFGSQRKNSLSTDKRENVTEQTLNVLKLASGTGPNNSLTA